MKYLKFTAEVEGNARIGFKYDYDNEFRAGTRYEDGKGWKDLSYFKENKNEFTFVRPELNFQAKAGVGFFLGVDVKIYPVIPTAGLSRKEEKELCDRLENMIRTGVEELHALQSESV